MRADAPKVDGKDQPPSDIVRAFGGRILELAERDAGGLGREDEDGLGHEDGMEG